MLDNMKQEIERTISPLLSGIVKDSHILVRQELALLKSEATIELEKVKRASIAVGVAAAAGLASLLLSAFSFVHLVAWLFPVLALWQSYAIGAIFFAGLAFMFISKSRSKVSDLDMTMPQTRESLREMTNV